MEPLDIRIALMRAGISQADIASVCQVSHTMVGRVINSQSASDRIQRMIAKAIGAPVDEVFPARQQRSRRAATVRERLTG